MKNGMYWFFQLFGWLLFGLYDLSTLYLRKRLTLEEIEFTAIFLSYCIFITETYHQVIKRNKWDKLSVNELIPRVAVSVTIMTVLINAFVVSVGIMWREKVAFKLEFAFGFLFYAFALSMLWSLFYFLWKYVQNNTKLSIAQIQMENTLKDLELKSIKSNLQPHFIFNALNSIRALVIENPSRSRDAIMQLSNILRNSLISDKSELVLLETEISILKDYLSLEQVRYEERLEVNYAINPKCLNALIPPMLLQTLAENAIKHGIAATVNGGFIAIKIDFDEAQNIAVEIENTGVYEETTSKEEGGFGLTSVKTRLNYLLGSKASFNIQNLNIGSKPSVIVTLIIPN